MSIEPHTPPPKAPSPAKTKTKASTKKPALHHDPENANDGSEAGMEMLEASISRCGLGRSIVADKNGTILAGNKTYEKAGELGLAEDPIIVETDGTRLVVVQRTDLDYSDSRAQELAIADNRVSEVNLRWNPEVLLSRRRNVELSRYFSELEIKRLTDTKIQEKANPDDIPPLAPIAYTKPGDVWLLGRHRLLCGDSTQIADLTRLMNGDKAAMLWTDPPYNVAIEGGTKDKLTILNDQMDDKAFFQFLLDFYTNALDACAEGAAFYIAHADSEGINFRSACKQAGWNLTQCLIWVKNALVLSRQDYHWQHEPILYGWKPGAAHRWLGNRKQSTVLNFDRPARSSEHPTTKPVALIEYCIRNNSLPDEIVLDCFLGSGSTLIAAEQSGRICYGTELSPNYCDVIIKRFQNFTDRPAILESTGQTFEEIVGNG